MWWLASVPDENASVIRRAGEHVIVDRADRQAVHSIDVQEHIQSFPPEGARVVQMLMICVNKVCRLKKQLCRWSVKKGSAYTHLSTS